MRHPRRAITLTELLTVVSVITILASMIAPILVKGRQEAGRQSCASNMNQMYRALSLYANSSSGKFPRCFDTSDPAAASAPIENSWWYRKISMALSLGNTYPAYTPYGFTMRCSKCYALYGATSVSCVNNPNAVYDTYIGGWGTGHPKDTYGLGEAGYGTWVAQRSILRCPASRFPTDFSHAPGYFVSPTTPGGDGTGKSRVFDDNYGYNNWGFSSGNSGYGFVYSNASSFTAPAVDPYTYKLPYYSISKYYHVGTLVPQGRFFVGDGRACPQCHSFWLGTGVTSCPNDDSATRRVLFGDIGAWSDFSDAASTIMVADYCKADASPFPGIDEGIVTETDNLGKSVNTAVTGYTFRHGGKINVLFAAGNVQGFARTAGFFGILGTPRAHWQVYR